MLYPPSLPTCYTSRAMKHSLIVREHVTTTSRSQIVDITPLVANVIASQQVRDGMVVVYVPHTTAAVTINENADPDVKHDFLRKLDELVPRREGYYRHGEGNSDSHVKTSLVGNSATALIENGQLVLGTWQGIYFCEFDGPRQREVLVKVVEW
jgi:secondary thiamine-phosphate synthase enzyme